MTDLMEAVCSCAHTFNFVSTPLSSASTERWIWNFSHICGLSPIRGNKMPDQDEIWHWKAHQYRRFTLTCRISPLLLKRMGMKPQNSKFGQICSLLLCSSDSMHQSTWNLAWKSTTEVYCCMPSLLWIGGRDECRGEDRYVLKSVKCEVCSLWGWHDPGEVWYGRTFHWFNDAC